MQLSDVESLQQLNDYMETLDVIKPVYFEDDKILLLDQTLLPFTEKYIELNSVKEAAGAIIEMKTRGAGAIAATALYGLLLNSKKYNSHLQLKKAGEILKNTRPTASTLKWMIDQVMIAVDNDQDDRDIFEIVEEKCVELMKDKLDTAMKVAHSGAKVIEDGDTVLTHCHAGAIAGIGYGGITTGVFKECVKNGKDIKVIATETRPYLQGARITSWELNKFDIPVTLITDNMPGYYLEKNKIDKVLVGADRVTLNGDVANKIGTYLIALAAFENSVPFYVGISEAGIDFTIDEGSEVPIEMRDPEEVRYIGDQRITLPEIKTEYPAFDITPHEFVSGFVTEKGIITPPYRKKFKTKYKK
ncbi:MAG: S-methyl-5-thioribose-1-phosphate isomerase [Halanaerobiales bacterium]